MPGVMFRVLILVSAITLPLPATAFRSCEVEHSEAYLATTQYKVTELSFDFTSGEANGTETTYTHSNNADSESTECHVTYELSGSIEPVSGVVVLDAHRSNHSVSCQDGLVEQAYPADRLYALVLEFGEGGHAQVRRADNGDLIASGDWAEGVTAFRTGEVCSLF
ncbi:MAG: hypothetical protein ABJL54_14595 [Halioglobus sp.]